MNVIMQAATHCTRPQIQHMTETHETAGVTGLKIFSENVGGCRYGSVKKYRKYIVYAGHRSTCIYK